MSKPSSTLAYGTADGRLLSVTGDFVGTTGTYTYDYQTNSDLIDTVTDGHGRRAYVA